MPTKILVIFLYACPVFDANTFLHKVHQALVLGRALDHVTIRQMKLLKKSDTYWDVEDALFKLRWVYICLRPHGNMEKQRSILCGIYMS